MNKPLKFTLIGILIVALVIQFFGPERPPLSDQNPDDLLVTSEVPQRVGTLLKTACYDCHSMETKYPWYSNIAPVSWMLFDHINEGRDELNFSTWATLKKSKKISALKDVAEEVEEGEMPLESYTPMHPEAELSEEDRQLIVSWAKEFSSQILTSK